MCVHWREKEDFSDCGLRFVCVCMIVQQWWCSEGCVCGCLCVCIYTVCAPGDLYSRCITQRGKKIKRIVLVLNLLLCFPPVCGAGRRASLFLFPSLWMMQFLIQIQVDIPISTAKTQPYICAEILAISYRERRKQHQLWSSVWETESQLTNSSAPAVCISRHNIREERQGQEVTAIFYPPFITINRWL